jgi:Dna[CI] antecedent, DciA
MIGRCGANFVQKIFNARSIAIGSLVAAPRQGVARFPDKRKHCGGLLKNRVRSAPQRVVAYQTPLPAQLIWVASAKMVQETSFVLPLPYRHKPPRGPGKISPRQRVCAQWRGIDLAPLQKAMASTAKSAGAVMAELLPDLRMDRRQAEAEVLKVWNHLMDPAIVGHAQPSGLRNGTLFVVVDSNVWLSEIVRYRRKEILTRLQHSFGRDLISKISFRIG